MIRHKCVDSAKWHANVNYCLIAVTFILSLLVINSSAMGSIDGQIVPDPNNPSWLVRKGEGPIFIAGPGDPEGFLYRGSRNQDGTRNGDQVALIQKLKSTGANSIYMQAVRSHGGDGDSSHNPFIDSYPVKGLDMDILDQWEIWFDMMEQNEIVIYFFFYDDSARIWNTGDTVGNDERVFIQSIVDRFEHYKNIIWCVAEEYQEKFTSNRIKNIAREIRLADDNDHVIAVHKLSGLDFSEFADDPNIDQFAMQYNVGTADKLHSGMVTAWESAAGRFNLNMTEARDMGTGQELRQKSWAVAMGGAYVMVLGMDIANTNVADMTMLGQLRSFFEATDFNSMSPNDHLKTDSTKYVLASPGNSYIAYSDSNGRIGIKNIKQGDYNFKWLDIKSGNTVIQESVSLGNGDLSWDVPNGFDAEVALYLRRTGDNHLNTAPVAYDQDITVLQNSSKQVNLNYSDSDGPGPYNVEIVSPPNNGSVSIDDTSITYTPDSNYLGADVIEWRISDNLAASNVALISIDVDLVVNLNNAPIVQNVTSFTVKNVPLNIQLVYSDNDGPGPYTVTIESPPSNGVLSGTGNDLTYTPKPEFEGTDQFSWSVSDGIDVSNNAVVVIQVKDDSRAINTISVKSDRSYLIVENGLGVGSDVYTDRDYTYTDVPDFLVGKTYIRTANDDKGIDIDDFMVIDVLYTSELYVGYDASQPIPSWLNDYTDTGLEIVTSDCTLKLFKQVVQPGVVILGGNAGNQYSSMYSVVLLPQDSGQDPDPSEILSPTNLRVITD